MGSPKGLSLAGSFFVLNAFSQSFKDGKRVTYMAKEKRKINAVIIVITCVVLALIGFSTFKGAESQKSPSVQSSTPISTNQTTITATATPLVDLSISVAEWNKERSDFETPPAKYVSVANQYKDPNVYMGKLIYFECVVNDFTHNDNGDIAGINCHDPNDFSSYIQIEVNEFDRLDYSKINKGDLLKIDGMGDGALSGKNAFGATVYTAGVVVPFGTCFFEDKTTGFINNK